jgi:hypothetical protein
MEPDAAPRRIESLRPGLLVARGDDRTRRIDLNVREPGDVEDDQWNL